MKTSLTTSEWLVVLFTIVGAAVGCTVWATSSFFPKDSGIRIAARTRGLETGMTEIRVNLKAFMTAKGVQYQEGTLPEQ